MEYIKSISKMPVGWDEESDRAISEKQEYSHPKANSRKDIEACYDDREAGLVAFWNLSIKNHVRDEIYASKMAAVKPYDVAKAKEQIVLNLMRVNRKLTQKQAEKMAKAAAA